MTDRQTDWQTHRSGYRVAPQLKISWMCYQFYPILHSDYKSPNNCMASYKILKCPIILCCADIEKWPGLIWSVSCKASLYQILSHTGGVVTLFTHTGRYIPTVRVTTALYFFWDPKMIALTMRNNALWLMWCLLRILTHKVIRYLGCFSIFRDAYQAKSWCWTQNWFIPIL